MTDRTSFDRGVPGDPYVATAEDVTDVAPFARPAFPDFIARPEHCLTLDQVQANLDKLDARAIELMEARAMLSERRRELEAEAAATAEAEARARLEAEALEAAERGVGVEAPLPVPRRVGAPVAAATASVGRRLMGEVAGLALAVRYLGRAIGGGIAAGINGGANAVASAGRAVARFGTAAFVSPPKRKGAHLSSAGQLAFDFTRPADRRAAHPALVAAPTPGEHLQDAKVIPLSRARGAAKRVAA